MQLQGFLHVLTAVVEIKTGTVTVSRKGHQLIIQDLPDHVSVFFLDFRNSALILLSEHHGPLTLILFPFEKRSQKILYGEITVCMLVIHGIALGVWLTMKRDTRYLVMSQIVLCQIATKGKKNRTHCFSLNLLCVRVFENSASVSGERVSREKKTNLTF